MYEIPSDPTITRVTITPEAVLKTGEPEITRDPQRTERPGRTRDGKAEHDPSAAGILTNHEERRTRSSLLFSTAKETSYEYHQYPRSGAAGHDRLPRRNGKLSTWSGRFPFLRWTTLWRATVVCFW